MDFDSHFNPKGYARNAPAGGGSSAYPNEQGYYEEAGYPQPAHHEPPPQPAFTASAYADNAPATEFEFHQGYAQREGLAPAAPAASTYNGTFGFLKSKWPAIFMAVTSLQAVLCLSFEAYVFGQFEAQISHGSHNNEVESQRKTIPTFLTLFIFGFLYELVVVWDALRLKNTIQVIGVCIANLALMVYTATQVDQINEALTVLYRNGALEPGITDVEIWAEMKPFLVAIPAIIALCTVCMAFMTWKLYQKFAWDILKDIGADYRMKKRFLHYQIYIALLKFDFFFFLGFIVQFVVVVTATTDPEFALTIATIPVTIIILLAAAYFTRKENKPGMVVVIVLYFGGLSYFVFKLVRIYQPGFSQYYQAVAKSLTAFAVITILLIILTIANAIICMRNFDSGLKSILAAKSRKRVTDEPDLSSITMNDVKQPLPSRMTID